MLIPVARMLLAIPASSSSCERRFRLGGLTYTKLRGNLSEKTGSDFMFASANLPDDPGDAINVLYLAMKNGEITFKMAKALQFP